MNPVSGMLKPATQNSYTKITQAFGKLGTDMDANNADNVITETRFRLLTFAIKFDDRAAYDDMVDQLLAGNDAKKRAMFDVRFKPDPNSTFDSTYFGVTPGENITGKTYPINPADILLIGSENNANAMNRNEIYLIVRMRPN